MSSSGDNAVKVRRPHDAQASREALLRSAREVFEELGYERATTREIGLRAGVDPALIARYFESKERLFLAALAEIAADEAEVDYDPPQAFVDFLLEYWEEVGHNPLSRALASPVLTEDMRSQVSALTDELLLKREVEVLRDRGIKAPQLRAEILVALAVGVAMTRANGTLEALAGASRSDVMAALAPLVAALGAG